MTTWPRSRRGRWAVRLVVVLAVLAGLAYGLDRAARAAADSLVSAAIEADPRVTEAHVAVEGLFFIPQVINGSYPHVRVHLSRIHDQGLTVDHIDADLYDVQVPLARVVRQDVAVIPVGHSRERAVITYAALNSYLKAQGQPVTVSHGTGNQLRLQAHLKALGQPFAVSSDAKVVAGPDYLDVTPTKLHTGSGLIDAASEVLLKVRLAFRIPTSPLPFGQRVQSIRATDAGLVVTATGKDVIIRR